MTWDAENSSLGVAMSRAGLASIPMPFGLKGDDDIPTQDRTDINDKAALAHKQGSHPNLSSIETTLL